MASEFLSRLKKPDAKKALELAETSQKKSINNAFIDVILPVLAKMESNKHFDESGLPKAIFIFIKEILSLPVFLDPLRNEDTDVWLKNFQSKDLKQQILILSKLKNSVIEKIKLEIKKNLGKEGIEYFANEIQELEDKLEELIGDYENHEKIASVGAGQKAGEDFTSPHKGLEAMYKENAQRRSEHQWVTTKDGLVYLKQSPALEAKLARARRGFSPSILFGSSSSSSSSSVASPVATLPQASQRFLAPPSPHKDDEKLIPVMHKKIEGTITALLHIDLEKHMSSCKVAQEERMLHEQNISQSQLPPKDKLNHLAKILVPLQEALVKDATEKLAHSSAEEDMHTCRDATQQLYQYEAEKEKLEPTAKVEFLSKIIAPLQTALNTHKPAAQQGGKK